MTLAAEEPEPARGSVAGNPITRTASNILDAVVTGLNALGSLWIFAMMAMITADVSSRYFFNQPIRGVTLLIQLSVAAIVFLQIAAVARSGRLTRSDLTIGKLLTRNPSLGHAVQACFMLAGFGFMALIFAYTWPLFAEAWTQNNYLGVAGDFSLPSWPTKLIVLVGSAACAIQFLRDTLIDLAFLRRQGAAARSNWIKAAKGVVAVIAVLLLMYLGLTFASSSPVGIGLLSVLFVLVTVYGGVHIGVALGTLSFFCVAAINGSFDQAGSLVALAAGKSLQQYAFGVIPLFVLMGVFVSLSDIAKDTYEVANYLFEKISGGLGMATVGANAVFAAVTGSSIASASVFTKIAVPEMLRHSYRPRFAVGVVAGSSVLGMLIPPSLLLIIFGILSESSIAALFLAGIVPGIILSVAFIFLIWLMAKRFPHLVTTPGSVARPETQKVSGTRMVVKSVPIAILIGAVLGGIYGGIFTATEAGAIGAFLALLITLIRKKLTWQNLWQALKETGEVSAAICFLLIAANIYSRMIALSGIPGAMESYLHSVHMGLWTLLAIYLVVVVALGTILDSGSIMLITVPLMVAAVAPFHANLIWLGIITTLACEVGLLTPPFGLSCFVIHNNLNDPRISVEDIFWGAAPFAAVMAAVLALLAAFPSLSLLFT